MQDWLWLGVFVLACVAGGWFFGDHGDEGNPFYRLRFRFCSKFELVNPAFWDDAHISKVRVALEKGASISARYLISALDKAYGWTPLHFATTVGDVAIVELLLDRGANINSMDMNSNSMATPSNTPLHLAASYESPGVALSLIRRGATVNVAGRSAWTPLHSAAEAGSVEVIELLLNNGARIDARDLIGNEPLHIAVSNGHAVAVTSLIERGADINTGIASGATPLDLSGSREITELLLSRGATTGVFDRTNALAETAERIATETMRPQKQQYNIVPKPTIFENRQYRSILEAKWAAFLSLCGWEHEYEPVMLEGWIPDFAIWGATGNTIWVEVKPVVTFPNDVAKKIEQGLPDTYRSRGDELLILGTKPAPRSLSAELEVAPHRLGWLARSTPGMRGWEWGDCIFGHWSTAAQFGFCHSSDSSRDRITGTAGDKPIASHNTAGNDLSRLWAEASNLVQWRSPRDR